jgi:benzoylformate decarboxylase
MPMMSGKRAFLELLRQEGVEVIFGNPGTTELPLMDALAVESAPRYVLALQEGAVMAMAGGYAQASGKLTAVNIHVAPGLGNAMGMLYDAHKAGAPILVTAGQHDQSFAVTEPILWAELPEIARPFVKWAVEVRRLADLPRVLHRAAKTALAPPTGPVFLSIPGDILNAEAEIDLGRPTRIATRLRGDAAAIAAAANLLAAAERPVILAGDGVAQSGALAELVKLAEAIGAPVHLEGMDNSAPFPSTHPLFRGPITRLAPQVRKTLAQHDLLLSIGGDLLTMSLPSEVEAVPPGLPIIHLDSDPWQLGKNYHAEVAILADPKAALPELIEAIAAAMSDAAKSAAARRRIALGTAIAAECAALKDRALAEAEKRPTQPLALWQAIGETLPKNIVVIDETLSSAPGLRQFLAGDDAKSFFGMRGGGIGWGLPAAVGVKLALPDRPVLALIGDGSALFNCQALWTAAHERLAVVFLILNNGAYRILKQRTNALRGHAAQTGRYVAMDLDDPPIDFVALADSMGVRAERAATLDEVRKALAAALAAAGPTLIDVILDPAFTPV